MSGRSREPVASFDQDAWQQRAARNNARWCARVASAHGVATGIVGGAVVCRTRSPELYPDAVTVARDCSVDDLLAGVDGSSGCSIKDSFAVLDLVPYGFEVLFDASWFVLDGPPTGSGGEPPRASFTWDVVSDRHEWDAWRTAWRGDGDDPDPFVFDLLDDGDDDLVFLAGWDGRRRHVIAGAVGNRDESVIGISNVFGRGAGRDPTVWLSTAVVALRERLGDVPIVGYDRADAADGYARAGFERCGPLRVWRKP